MSGGIPTTRSVSAHTLGMFQFLVDLDTAWRWKVGDAHNGEAVARLKTEFVARWREPVRRTLDAHFAAMSSEIEALTTAQRREEAVLYRQLVQPYWLQSRFVRRAADRPLGYPGDYGVVELIFAGRELAPSPLGTLLGDYALQSGPSEAHRGRHPWAAAQLDGLGLPRPRVLSYACGPEVVLRRWVAAGGEADIVLADHDPAALAWASGRLARAIPPGNTTTLRTVVSDARAVQPDADILAALGEDRPFDAVTVLGLLDYLDDVEVVRFVGGLAGAVREGGTMLLSNLRSPNPWRALMELTADWNVVHRSVEGFEALMAATGRFGQARTTVHESGTNLYCAVQRVR